MVVGKLLIAMGDAQPGQSTMQPSGTADATLVPLTTSLTGTQIQTGTIAAALQKSAASLTGNNLQIYDYGDDLDDSTRRPFAKTSQACFYYNVKADSK